MHVKRINEFNDSGRYCYIGVESLNKEIRVPETFCDEFKEQFNDADNKQLLDIIMELYDFASTDRKPDVNDREELLSWLYEYCCAMIDGR